MKIKDVTNAVEATLTNTFNTLAGENSVAAACGWLAVHNASTALLLSGGAAAVISAVGAVAGAYLSHDLARAHRKKSKHGPSA